MNNNKSDCLHTEQNDFGQLVGQTIDGWQGVLKPPKQMLIGDHTELRPVNFELHAQSLWSLIQQESDASCWTYLPYGAFTT